MAHSFKRRFTALMVFTGLVPVSALAAQSDMTTGPQLPACSAKVALSSNSSVTAVISRQDTDYAPTHAYTINIKPMADTIDGVDWNSASRPDLSIRQERAAGKDKAKYMSLGSPAVAQSGKMVFPSWNTTFAYNGVEQAGSTTSRSLTYLPGLNEIAADLDSDIVLTLNGVGTYGDAGIKLRFSRSEAIKAAKQGSTLLSDIERRYEDGKCMPQVMTGGLFMPGCFLTSAACDTIGLADDCWELASLRRFRDDWLAYQPGGAQDIATYYTEAPAIAARLLEDPKSLVRLYWTRILPSALASRLGLKKTARRLYHRMMRDLTLT